MGVIQCNCSAIGALGKLLTETTGSGATPRTFTNTSDRIEFIYEKLGTTRIIQHTNAITGSVSRLKTGVREHSYLTQGVIAVQPSPAALELWLPRILGGTKGAAGSGNGTDIDSDGADRDFPLANILPTWDALVYRENGIFQYTNLQVAQAILRGRTSNGGEANEFMELILVVVGEQEIITEDGDASPWPGTEPALATGASSLPYAFWESEFYLNSTEVPYEEIALLIDNQLSVKFYNELYPTCIRSMGRVIKVDAKLPFTCTTLDEALSLNTTTGTAELLMKTPLGTPVFHSNFELPYVRSTFKTPVIEGKTDIPLELSLEAFANTGLDEMVVTNDAAA